MEQIIPKEVAEISEDTKIPSKVAEIIIQEDVEIKPYLISFEKYNKDLCELKSLDGKNAKRGLSILKEIGVSVFCREDIMRNGDINTSHIMCAGEYKKLYRGLHEGVEIKEIHLKNSGRIFYFDVIPDNIMYIIAIKENHFETKKIRI
ncbi:MAG: hypothetical protein RI996_214 [Candidatus Parcubacteria bacterium]|jgi:hypothetical protein